MLALLPRQFPPDERPPVAPEAHISYGQSWRSNAFPSFGAFGLNPQTQTLLAPKVDSIGAFLGPGPLPTSAGISLTGNIIGVTGFQSSDVFSIGRCAIIATQLWRLYRGATYLKPILEFCAAYPASTWQTGNGGGLSPGASFTASVTNGSMSVTAVASRTLSIGQRLAGAGIPANCFVLGGANPGTTGTYRVGVATTVIAGAQFTTSGGAQFLGHIGAAAPNDTLTVESVTAGTVTVGDTIISGMPVSLPVTTINAFLTGTNGGVGTYRILIGPAINTASGPLQTQGVSWTNQATILASIQSVLPQAMQAEVDAMLGTHAPEETGEPVVIDPRAFDGFDAETRLVAEAMALHAAPDPDVAMAFRDIAGTLAPRMGYLDAIFRSVGYTQGGAADNTQASKVADLTDMLTLYDAMSLPGTATTPLNFYFCMPAGISNSTVYAVSNMGTLQFCRDNAPGQGGTWSGRAFFSSISYAWQFNGNDNIHTGDYGTTRWGEWEGYAKHLVEDLGVPWTPLWRPLSGGAITRVGQVVSVPFARPNSPDFATTPMVWQNNRDDGVKEWPAKGFHVVRSGVQLTVTPAINGLSVDLTIAETINAGDVLEVSYAWYGPGGPNPSTDPGLGGNLCMNGPASVLYPQGWNGAAKTLDAWAVPFIETVVV